MNEEIVLCVYIYIIYMYALCTMPVLTLFMYLIHLILAKSLMQ